MSETVAYNEVMFRCARRPRSSELDSVSEAAWVQVCAIPKRSWRSLSVGAVLAHVRKLSANFLSCSGCTFFIKGSSAVIRPALQ
jgi:hypothetical protein